MSRRQLTHKQHAFLEFLQLHVRDQKVWPTYREIVEHFDYRSPNSVTQNMQALAKKGFLRRDYNGYHLVDRQGKDGSIPLQGVLRAGRLDGAGEARFSFAALFPGVTGLQALHLDGDRDCSAALREAHYVFLADGEPAEGDLAVVLHEGALTLRTLHPNGLLVDPDGACPPLHRHEAEVLGRYAGHAGAYGLVRHAVTPRLAAQLEPEAAEAFA